MRSKYGKRGVPRALRKGSASDDRPGWSGGQDGRGEARATDGPGRGARSEPVTGADRGDRPPVDAGERSGDMSQRGEPGAAAAAQDCDAAAVPPALPSNTTAQTIEQPDGRAVQVYWKHRRSVNIGRDDG